MRVGAHQGVRIGHRHIAGPFGHDYPSQIFKIYLVTDARIWGDDVEIIKAFLGPLEQGIAFGVTVVFFGDIPGNGIGRAKIVDLNRMIDNQIHRDQWIYFLRIATQLFDSIAHGCKIDHRRNARKILHQHPCRVVRNFNRRIVAFLPARDIVQVFFEDHVPVQLAQQVFNQNFNRIGQALHIGDAVFLQQRNIKKGVGSLFCI